MAEAGETVFPLRFFCHQCVLEIHPNLPEYTCPRCTTGFVEELAQHPPDTNTNEESDEDNVDPSIQFAELWRELIQDVVRREEDGNNSPVYRFRAGENRPQEATNDPNDQASHSLFRQFRHRRTRPRGVRQMQPMGVADMEGGLHQLLASLTGNRGYPAFSGFPIFFNLHGNPGDYAWGRGGLDAVISQLLNQLDGTGPPPLSKEKIEEIPSIEICKEQVDMALQCTVCMEDFRTAELVKRLACQHHFHMDCIIPWLELHGTCPICRKILHDNQTAPGSNGGLDLPGTSSTASSSRSSSTETSNSVRSSQSDSSSSESTTGNSLSTSSSSNSHPVPSVYEFIDEFD